MSGNFCSSSDFSNIYFRGVNKAALHSFSNIGWILSGP